MPLQHTLGNADQISKWYLIGKLGQYEMTIHLFSKVEITRMTFPGKHFQINELDSYSYFLYLERKKSLSVLAHDGSQLGLI